MEEEIRFLEMSLIQAMDILEEYKYSAKYKSVLVNARAALMEVPEERRAYVLRRIVEDIDPDAVDGFYSGDVKKTIQCIDGIVACQLLLEHLVYIREGVHESKTLH